MADEYLIRFLDEDNIPQDISIVRDINENNYLGAVNRNPLNATHSLVAGVAVDETETIYQETISGSPVRLKKIVVTGQTDGFFKAYLGSDIIAFGKIGAVERVWKEDFAGGCIYIPVGSTFRIDVLNTGIITSNYESIVYKGI